MSEQTSKGPGTQPLNPLKPFLADQQDPNAVQKAHSRVSAILTSSEQILYIAVQTPLISLSPDCVVLTNRRFIIFRPTLLGGANFSDFIWQDLSNAHLAENMLTSTLSFTTVNNQRLMIEHLPKQQARRLYAFAQEMEEKVRVQRRQMQLEEKRAGAGGIVMQSPAAVPVQQQPVAASEDPVETLGKLKRMLDAGLITQGEYDSKKQEILKRL